MAEITIDMIGLKEVEQMLKSMPDQFNYKFLTGAHKQALKPFINEAKNRAPVGKKAIKSRLASRTHDIGNLRDSLTIGLAPKIRKRAGVWAGARSKSAFRKGAIKPDAYYAHMVEFGHKGRDGKMVAPVPFLRPAWDATSANLKNEVQKSYIDRMKRHVKKWMKNARG